MVLVHDNMEPERLTERRVSSPIGIPNAKLATLNQMHQNILETSESPENSASPVASLENYGSSLPVMSSSVPARPINTHPLRFLSDSTQISSINSGTESSESINEILDRLPDCSPAFSAVFSEILKLDAERRQKEETNDGSSKNSEPKHPDEGNNSPQNNSHISKREMKILRFAVDDLHQKLRPRAASGSYIRRSHKDTPSSTHSTPALSRRARNKNSNAATNTRAVNLVPKFKFLTETVTVSHEDIVKEHERQEKHRNGFPSPKSIFGVLEESPP